ncbi:MAG TPA: M28 family peptidase [Bacillales bacterium]
MDYDDDGKGFPSVMFDKLEGTNVIGYKRGLTGKSAIVVGAHYDSVRDSPGADDNGAGVAALLELAGILRPFVLFPISRLKCRNIDKV